MTDRPQITTEISEGLMTITLDRPDALNALTPSMMHEIIAAFDVADSDDRVRAVLVTGSGARAFCAGADLSRGSDTFDYERGSAWADAGSPYRPDGSLDGEHPGIRDGGGILAMRIFEARKPVVGVVNGAAVGVGATMTLPMDFVFAADTARFGFVFSRLGIVPEAASSWFLPRRVGIGTALEWCYAGRLIAASEARDAGLVREVLPATELMAAARSFTLELVGKSAPVSIALTRAMMWRMMGASSPMDAHRLDSRLMWARGASADAAEGISAFVDKRDATFGDRVSNADDLYRSFLPLETWNARKP